MLKKKIKMIEPGWGSTGYYSAEVLRRDGPIVFPIGTKMLDTHLNNNPRGTARTQGVSLRDLFAESVTTAEYLSDAPDGPGLYVEFAFFEKVVEELGRIASMRPSFRFTLA